MNKVMVITGSSKSIGKYLAQYYVEKGFKVVGCSRQPADYELENYQHFCLDVCDEVKVKQMFGDIQNRYGRLDVLINNAGLGIMNYALLTPLQTVRKTLDTNYIGSFLFCREAAKLMQTKRYGRIVNISSIAVALTQPGTSTYGASKAALEQFSKVLAKELIAYGITVNVLGLSFVKDSGMAEAIAEKSIQETLERTTSKSWLSFEDVAKGVDAFIFPENDKLTGQTIYLGGLEVTQ